MQKEHLVFLPGLDGTGHLFAPVLDVLPPNYTVSVVSYPLDQTLGYSQLFSYLEEKIPPNCDFTLVAESFSGPLAIQFASTNPARLKALILCTSFVTSPLPKAITGLRDFINDAFFSIAPPNWALRYWMLGTDCPGETLALTQAAIRQVAAKVLAHRVRLVMNVDERETLRKCEKPILYLQATKDRLIQDRGWKALRVVKPQTQYREIAGPHLLLQCQPQETMRAIDDFLRSLNAN